MSAPVSTSPVVRLHWRSRSLAPTVALLEELAPEHVRVTTLRGRSVTVQRSHVRHVEIRNGGANASE